MKRKILMLSFMCTLLLAILLVAPNFVSAKKVDPDELIKKIAPDGKNATFYMKKPKINEEGYEDGFTVEGYVKNILKEEECRINAGYENNACVIYIYSLDYNTVWVWDDELETEVEHIISGWSKKYELNITFVEPKTNATVDDFISKLNAFEGLDKSFIVEDLSLINFYLTSESHASDKAIKYSNINNIINGSNITYYLDIKAGQPMGPLGCQLAYGPMSIFYNGYSYATKSAGVYLNKVIYIPEDTADTKEAYVAAAKKKLKDYLGNSSVTISYGGTISSIPHDSEEGYSEEDLFPVKNDGNYYNVKIKNRTYKFYIVKTASSDKLEKPKYVGKNIESKIEITSENASIPLDTSVTVEVVEDSTIKDKIGTKNCISYDISLHSESSGTRIEKIENGEFSVKIPIPTELKGKELTVYYIGEDDKVEEHKVTVEDEYAKFTTDHFSIYTLAEKISVPETIPTTPETTTPEKDDTPKTGTVSKINYVFVSTILVGVGILVLKKNLK